MLVLARRLMEDNVIGTCRAACEIAAAPDVVFDAVTDLAALPRWNAVVVDVADVPAVLAPVRARMPRGEVAASLDALARLVATPQADR